MADELVTTDVPIETHTNDTPNPAEKTLPGAEKPSVDDAVSRAFEKHGLKDEDDSKPASKPKEEAKEKKPEPEKAKEPKEVKEPEEKTSPDRSEDGKFKSREPKEPEAEETSTDKEEVAGEDRKDGTAESRPSEGRNIKEPPSGFLPRAREKWSSVDPEVQSEMHRLTAAFEKGKAEYQEDREFRKDLRSYEEMAREHGTTVKQALEQYTAIDRLLKQSPLEGIERVLSTLNITPQQYANHILQNPPQQRDPNVTRLEQQVSQLTQQLQQVTQSSQQTQQQAAEQQVEANIIAPFRASLGANDRYEELKGDIAFFLNSDRVPSNLSAQQRLAAAYDMAERINPAPRVADEEPRTTAPAAQLIPGGNKSVSGSPSSGIPTLKPKKKGEQVSIDDALTRAFQRHVG